MVTLAFPRELRLLTPKDFQFVFQEPSYTGLPKLAILGRKNSLNHPRLGVVIAKKVAKRAHDRNRFKRLSRESFRHRQHQLPAMDFIVIAKKNIIELDNQQLTALLNNLWDRQIHLASTA